MARQKNTDASATLRALFFAVASSILWAQTARLFCGKPNRATQSLYPLPLSLCLVKVFREKKEARQ